MTSLGGGEAAGLVADAGISPSTAGSAPAPAAFPEPVEDPLWRIEIDGFDPLTEREVEAWFTVGNGRSGTRGSLEEASEHSLPASYVAGVYGKTDDELGILELLTGPTWTRVEPTVGDELLALDRGIVLEHRRVLDLRHGLLFRLWRHRLPSGEEVTFRSVRLASLAERELVALEAELQATTGPVSLAGAIPLPAGPAVEDAIAHEREGRVVIEVVGRDGGRASFAVSTREQAGRLERLVAMSRSCSGEPGSAESALSRLGRAERDGIAEVRARHCDAWRARWGDADILVEGDEDAQRALRFALYHLISAAEPDSDVASIGARGLTGPGYSGHVFWDTDVFVLPFFVYSDPATARALLAYRHRTLPAARRRAELLGYRGALYAWESAHTGDDVTPPYLIASADGARIDVLTGEQEHHISADIAWAVWRYWQATGDHGFLADMGAEIVLETARFWASRARRGRDGRYHISRVIGPDEYHEGVRDNAFTNVMARWNLERGLQLAAYLREADPDTWRALTARLALRTRELDRWRLVAGGLVDGFDPQTLLYEQFAGFFTLEDVFATELAPRPFAGEVILGAKRLHRSQLAKQADVLMLPLMLPDVMDEEIARRNYDYYEPRSSHGSSLSPAIHGVVAARVGELEDALAYLRLAASIDLGETGNSAQGIHMATIGGLWLLVVFGFGGLRPDDECLRIDPRLPRDWRRLRFPLVWRGVKVEIDCDHAELRLTLTGPAAVALGSHGPSHLAPGHYRARRGAGGWSPLEESGT